MAALHRLAQGLGALFAFARSPDLELARRYLSACEYDAFRLMARSEQLHSLNALRKILDANRSPPTALICAALLHDLGKSRYHLSVAQKTLAVVIEALAPWLARRLGEGESLSVWAGALRPAATSRPLERRDPAGMRRRRRCDLAGGAASGRRRRLSRSSAASTLDPLAARGRRELISLNFVF